MDSLSSTSLYLFHCAVSPFDYSSRIYTLFSSTLRIPFISVVVLKQHFPMVNQPFVPSFHELIKNSNRIENKVKCDIKWSAQIANLWSKASELCSTARRCASSAFILDRSFLRRSIAVYAIIFSRN